MSLMLMLRGAMCSQIIIKRHFVSLRHFPPVISLKLLHFVLFYFILFSCGSATQTLGFLHASQVLYH